jgi:glucose/arabinose dehydrogenase
VTPPARRTTVRSLLPRRLVAAFTAAVVVAAVVAPSGAGAAGPRPAADRAGAAQAAVPPPAAPIGPAGGLVLTPFLSGLSQPVLATHAGDGSGRLFIVEKVGRIKVRSGGRIYVFLDIRDHVSQGSEQGLLGLAFHPNYESNRKFYINYTNTSGDTVIREVRRTSSPLRASLVGSRVVMRVNQPFANHNGGHLAFQAGLLYIGLGDGGGSGDPGNRAQNLNTLLGKMLRINVDTRTGGRAYGIPSSNPYVGRAGLDEIWSRGLRNPWRFSFDRANGNLWIGDVGQGRYEEIDRSVRPSGLQAGRGVNYGWRIMEGRHCFIPSPCTKAGKVSPIVEYAHSVVGDDNCSVTGGYVYRGPVAGLVGQYFFGDFCSGRIWTIPASATNPADPVERRNTSLNISSFGEGETGRLFVVSLGGSIYTVGE